MKKKLVSILHLAIAFIRVELHGVKASPIVEPKREKTIVYPDESYSLEDWAKMFNVSSKVPKRIKLTLEQVADKFGVSRDELVIF